MLDTLFTTVKRWHRDEGPLLAAAVSYYIALSLFPVLLILTSALGAFFKWTDNGHSARDYLLQVIGDQMAPALANSIGQSLAHIEDYASLSGPIGFAILVFAALAIFSQFERAFARIWNVPSVEDQSIVASVLDVLTGRLRAFLLLCSLGLLMIGVFVVGVVVAAIQQRMQLAHTAWVWRSLELVLPVSINAFAFAALYRFLPRARVRWSDAWRGGLFAAVVWEIGLLLVAKLLIGNHYSSAYGVIGCFMAVMLWGYYAMSVVFFGAELVQVLGERAILGVSDHVDRNLPESTSVELHSELRVPATKGKVRIPWWVGRGFDMAVASVLIYVAMFLGFRQFRSYEPSTMIGDTQQVVRFSDDPDRHRLAMRLFAPLIRSLPGHYDYASTSDRPPIVH